MTQEERLDTLVEAFRADSGGYPDYDIPADTAGKRRVLRSLMNVRMPRHMAKETLRIQDEYLQERAEERGIVRLNEIPPVAESLGSKRPFAEILSLWQGDITRLAVDAIVNAANSQMLGCFRPCHSCIDNCIHTYAGIQLRAECDRQMQALRFRYGRDYEQPTAVPMLTDGYNLPAKKVVHIVGPIVYDTLTPELENDLADCYRNTLDICPENGLRSVAFCSISTGVFRFPKERASEIAVQTVTEWLAGHPGAMDRIISAVRGFGYSLCEGTGSREENIARLKEEVKTAGAVVIGAGAGLSTAAGLTYSGERFERYFFDFIRRFGITDMYSGGFYPFPDDETRWAWWARHIYFNRYIDPPKPAYADLLALVKDKDYFVITTNVDHQFQRAGFDKSRLFYTQGDYGLFQDAQGRGGRTWDNEEWTMLAMEAQGFVWDENGGFQVPADRKLSMRLPRDLIPTDPKTGRAVAMNLRADDTFVEDAGWHAASANYAAFLKAHEGQHVLFMELGVGGNTPVIIKYPFWAMTAENPKAVYACLNRSEAVCPRVIEARSICIDGDTGEVIKRIL